MLKLKTIISVVSATLLTFNSLGFAGEKEKKLIIAGIDNPSVKGTLEDADAYINLGVDVLRIRIPRRRDTIDEYFNEVLEKISGPVLIIHQMAPGGFTNSMTTEGADPDQIGRFCSYDSVVGYIASHLVRFEMMTRKFISKLSLIHI